MSWSERFFLDQDEVNFKAMTRLKEHGLTVDNVLGRFFLDIFLLIYIFIIVNSKELLVFWRYSESFVLWEMRRDQKYFSR